MSPYAKFIVALLGALAGAVRFAATDSVITGEEWVSILIAGITAVGVYLFPNKDQTPV